MKQLQIRTRYVYCIVLALVCMSISGRSENRELPSAHQLLAQFKTSQVFWQQFDIGKQIVALNDPSILADLQDWIDHEDRHIRGNVAFIFASLGDDRGLQVIQEILTDQSDRPVAQGIPMGNETVKKQINADRYYAAHLLGILKDKRALPILIPLLKDRAINYKVAWALGETGDSMAIEPLTEALNDENPDVKVIAIDSLVKLQARSALPQLHLLLTDTEKSRFGEQITVAAAARNAIMELEKKP